MKEAATVLAGVTRVEAENALATFLAKGSISKADLSELSKVKDRIFADISGLERVVLTDKELGVGGLAGLNNWLKKSRDRLTDPDLRARNLRPPRGVLLVGVPGCGKSLSAKFIAVTWQLPLYRLDLANIHGQYVGQSEGRLKEALSTADRVAPCVLWIDEIEKGLAGAGGSGDGGTSTRVLGHFLYWLQESSARVFVVATANDISRLPPSFLGVVVLTSFSSSIFRRRPSVRKSSRFTSANIACRKYRPRCSRSWWNNPMVLRARILIPRSRRSRMPTFSSRKEPIRH